MRFAFTIFDIYPILIGALICKASCVPKLLGVLMVLGETAWIITSLQPCLFYGYDLSWMMLFSTSELSFGSGCW
jgi:hypothetical protein